MISREHSERSLVLGVWWDAKFFENIPRLKNILSTLKINVDILPSLYRDYLKQEKSKQKSKTISH